MSDDTRESNDAKRDEEVTPAGAGAGAGEELRDEELTAPPRTAICRSGVGASGMSGMTR